jgi:hypothetical protein
MLLERMQTIAQIQNKLNGPDWEEIEDARRIANNAIAACTETKQVLAGK